jgi:rubredoxin
MSQSAFRYSRTAGGLRVRRGSRVVGEIHEPITGGSREYWFRSLLSPAKGTASTLAEAKQRLEYQIGLSLDSHERSARLIAEAKAAAPQPRPGASIARQVECPDCHAMVRDLVRHRRETHSIAAPQALQPRRARESQRVVPPPNYVKCPACESFIKKENLESHLVRVHGRDRTRIQVAPAANTPSGDASLGGTNKRGPSLDDYVCCPDCRVQVKARNLEKHRRKHPEIKRAKAARKELTGPAWKHVQDEVQCADCGLWVFSEELAGHRRTYHPPAGAVNPATPNRRSPVGKKPTKPSSIAVCAECNKRIRRHMLAAHMIEHRKAKVKAERSTRGTSVPSRGARSSTPAHPSQFDPSTDERANRALDATRDQAHSFRERGRFGSGPSYDDYGEESKS